MESFGKVVKIHSADNVAVALHDLLPGEQIDTGSMQITVKESISAGHKIAWEDIPAGENVIKYSYPIGHTTETISQGTWVHTHNVKTNLDGLQEYNYSPKLLSESENEKPRDVESITFQGYIRNDGQV